MSNRTCIGVVGSPQQHEATSKQFHFWVARDVLVEETQLVVCESAIAGRTFTFYGIVDEVCRRSRKRSMDDEIDQADGEPDYVPPFESDGYTYASVSILCVSPAALTPPCERSKVLLANQEDAAIAYSADEIEKPLMVGLIKNGGEQLAGPGLIDRDYLLGENGGHLNVNGSAGRGTKSSYLLQTNWQLLYEARRQERERPSDLNRLQIVPIILNVKNFDLFYIDRWSKRYDPDRHLSDWQSMEIDNPLPFQNVSFFAPQQQGNSLPVPTKRNSGVEPYSWSLSDIIERELFSYLFAEIDAYDANFSALAMDLENLLTREITNTDSSVTRSLNQDRGIGTFQELLDWINEQSNTDDGNRVLRNHHSFTWKKLYRRLLRLVYESKGVLRREANKGKPLDVVRTKTSDPLVIDLSTLAGAPGLQRFVVATIFRQLVEARSGARAIQGLVYLVTLDELNRFAPKGARDPITQLIENVASEMRSQGIILLGAQQQASKVSEKVIENSAIRVLGRTGTLELSAPVWKFLSESARAKASTLQLNEKLVIQDNFREPMLVKVPFPVWAMNPNEARDYSPQGALENDEDDFSDLIDN